MLYPADDDDDDDKNKLILHLMQFKKHKKQKFLII